LQGPTDDEKREIALSLGGRKPGVAQITDAKLMTNHLLEQFLRSAISREIFLERLGETTMSNAAFSARQGRGFDRAAQVPQLKLETGLRFSRELTRPMASLQLPGAASHRRRFRCCYSIDAATGVCDGLIKRDASVRTRLTSGPVKGHGAAEQAVLLWRCKSKCLYADAAHRRSFVES